MAYVQTAGLLWSIPARTPRAHASASQPTLEVTASWNENVLSVRHLRAPFAFSVGDGSLPCDLVVPEELSVGARRVLIGHDLGQPTLYGVDAGSTPLEFGRPTTLRLGELTLTFLLTNAESGSFGREPLEREVFGYFGLSLALAAAMMASLAAFVPPLGLTDEEDLDRDRLATMFQFLNAQAEREQPPTPGERDVGQGERSAPADGSKGASGAMGKPTETQKNRRFSSSAQTADRDTSMSRAELLADARDFGIIGLLAVAAPVHPGAQFDSDGAINRMDRDAFGNMFGQDIGDAAGVGGLGILGLGEGSGGKGLGIGMGGIGTCQTLGGCNGGEGFASSRGLSNRSHVSVGPRLRVPTVGVSGSLPPEVIQRVVRQNFGRFRLCYETGLRNNPTLNGRVAARFVIDRTGAVSAVQNGGSDIPDSGVVNCVMSAFYGLSFPAPDNGVVRVTYPIIFSVG